MRAVVRELAIGQTSDGRPKRVLEGIDLTVPRGGLFHVVGPTGAGKSSLIRLINRLDEPTSGTLNVLGRPIHQWKPHELRRRVAMVFQEPSLLRRSVRENLRLPFQFSDSVPDDIDLRIEQALRLAHLDNDLLDREAAQLSVGQKQQVTLARALITEPLVLLLDEPTSALDRQTASQFLSSLVDLRRERPLTIVMVTHRLSEARKLGGQMLVLINGRPAALDEVDRLLQNPPSARVRDFLWGTPNATA